MISLKNPNQKKRSWWSDRILTLMVIPERTRRVHKIVLPVFALKTVFTLVALFGVFLVIVSIDYVHVLGRLTENKRLKGENFKLRQELQLIRNKVDSMESSMERVRNYAKKLQILTGQEEKKDLSEGALFKDMPEREPAEEPNLDLGERHSELSPDQFSEDQQLRGRIEKLQYLGENTETGLAKLQSFLMQTRAIADATPSILPIAGYLSSGFGYRRHPIDGTYRMHQGVDITAEPGTPVRATANGIVRFAGDKSGYGKVAVVDHGYGITTLFAHNARLFVTPGMRIKRGQTIAQVGTTGSATGPHLHYEVRKNGVAVNPVPFFTRASY